ncbi:hypothetical protein QBC38DRAFT_457008 [Podospora fimiseda]|uniref:Uncharacterized protein n=1 Tax=Podospora fimiseda TaxID=252190 RepID=A0AAN7GVF1_9PEZI|nr:hypothetical protein QBC38DRAFT_457008 [Podospora fimiseda]
MSIPTEPSTDTTQYPKPPRWNHFGPIPHPHDKSIESAERHAQQLRQTNPEIVQEFETTLDAWKERWHKVHYDSWATESEQYDNLLEMGDVIIPLVVHELTKPENFGACCLYNELEQDKSYKVDPEDTLNFMILNRQAYLIVDYNHERNKDVGTISEGST